MATAMSGPMSSGMLTDDIGPLANGSLLHAELPAVLVETAFITSDDEAAMFTDGTGARQQEIASAVAGGVLASLSVAGLTRERWRAA